MFIAFTLFAEYKRWLYCTLGMTMTSCLLFGDFVEQFVTFLHKSEMNRSPPFFLLILFIFSDYVKSGFIRFWTGFFLTIFRFLLTGTGFSKLNSFSYQPEPEFLKANPVSYQPEPEFRQITGIPVHNSVPVVPYP